MADATVIGAAGFIGSALVERLRRDGLDVAPVGRGDPLPSEAGHIYYCAGLTADFRERPHDAVEAHVTALSRVLREANLASLTYLSSTRVYQRAESGREDALIPTDPNDPLDLYALSKLTGESLCLSDPRPVVRVIRPSNVVGRTSSPSFLSSLIQDARQGGLVVIRSSPDSAKDYVGIDDVVEALVRIPARAKARLINVASGKTVTNREVAGLLQGLFGVEVGFEGDARPIVFPDISIGRLRDELGVEPEPLAGMIPRLFGAAP